MGKKHYSQSIKDEAVLFYELGHSFAETQAKYGMAESTFFTWKQKFDKACSRQRSNVVSSMHYTM